MSNSKSRAKEDALRENNREPALDWGGQGRPPEEVTPKLQCESTRRSQPGGGGKYTSERGERAAEAPKCRHSASGRTEENKPRGARLSGTHAHKSNVNFKSQLTSQMRKQTLPHFKYGLVKKFAQVSLYDVSEKPELTFWLTQYVPEMVWT